jgi:hypothetical protein
MKPHKFFYRAGALLLVLALAGALVAPISADDTAAGGTVSAEDTSQADSSGEDSSSDSSSSGDSSSDYTPVVDVLSVSIATTARLDEIGDTKTLTYIIEPSNATDRTLTWKSGDTSVATVDKNGKVTAVAPGEAEITATSSNGKSGSCTVTVSGVRLTSSTSDESLESLNLYLGQVYNLNYHNYGAAIGSGAAIWESEDNLIVSVSGGRLYARDLGKTTISVDIGGYVAKCSITVTEDTTKTITEELDEGENFSFEDILSDINSISRSKAEGDLRYISNLAVSTPQGTLYYNYVSPASPGIGVGATEKYYYSDSVAGQRSISGITFVPDSDFQGTAVISYTGYSTAGKTFSGDIRLEISAVANVNYATTSDTPLSFRAEDFNTVCQNRSNRELNYVTFTLPASTKGTLYYNYVSDSEYSEKIVAGEAFYRTRSPLLSNVTFVPADDYTGTVQINYRAIDSAGSGYNGKISISVTAASTGSGNVTYSVKSSGKVTFEASDFNTACRKVLDENLSYVQFDLPAESQGKLYYNYRSSSNTGTAVSDSTRYYRSSSPYISNITFVPASTADEVVVIPFTARGVDSDRYDGEVRITISDAATGDGTVTYSCPSGNAVSFDTADFNAVCKSIQGVSLDYIQFTSLPDSNRGTLYYNYRSSSKSGSSVSTSYAYYRTDGTRLIENLTFVAKSGYTGTSTIKFNGYDIDGNRFTGTVSIEITGTGYSDTVTYSTISGRAVAFSASDFNTICKNATGSNLNYVRFTLPAATKGILYESYSEDQTSNTRVYTSTNYYRTGSGRLLDNVSFVPASGYSGTAEFEFTGYNTSGNSFSGTVSISVSQPVLGTVTLSGSSLPLVWSSESFNSVCTGKTGRTLSYITLTAMPSSTYGKLYLNYTGLSYTGMASAGTKYYYSGTPAINQLVFVPKAGYSGTFSLSYTGVDTKGESYTGTISVTVTPNTFSNHFSDMGQYSWAVPHVEFLYQVGVVSGTSDTQYSPAQAIRRCDFVLLLCNVFKLQADGTNSFSDVPSSAYYAQAVTTAQTLGIISGSNGRFLPEQPLTRQDAMVMLYRAMQISGQTVSASLSNLNSFSDGGQISSYARDAVSAMFQLGIISGDNAGKFNPTKSLTRAEVAVILHQVLTL